MPSLPSPSRLARTLGRLLALGVALLAAPIALAQATYPLFEAGPVRPLAFSPNGQKLFVVNTPDARLEIFRVDTLGRLTPIGSVAVGLEPVAVAARNDGEVWVVNHLSDSVSIVDVAGARPRVVRTLLVGDEPNDIVFAGPGNDRAFVSAAHRGQNAPVVDGDYDLAGLGRADVYVFQAGALGTSLEGDRLAVVTLFGDKPRALARNAAGDRVYAAVFRSGNRTTTIHEQAVCDTSAPNRTNEVVQSACVVGGGANATISPGGLPTPLKNHAAAFGPETGLIVRQNRDGQGSGAWQDELGRDWSALVRFDLPDQDVFTIDASAAIPSEIGTPFSGVGTSLFNMAVHPGSGRVFVTNTEAMNHVRFEGPGIHVTNTGTKPALEPASVRGDLARARITILDPTTGAVSPRPLNKHIPYGVVPVPPGVKEKSLSTPLALEFSADGGKVYVAGFGSGRIGVYDVAALENDTFTVQASDPIPVGGGGPSGLVRRGGKLYVTTRFDNALRIIDLATKAELQRIPLANPEPAAIVAGRPFLYDANRTGSNGEASCAACHLFGDMDDLAWDLGDPDGDVAINGNPFNPVTPAIFIPPAIRDFHPHKGPMTTQSLRGLANMGPQHWRGDRQGNEIAAFEAFNVAFPGLIGRDEGLLPAADMTAFREFALLLRYPPNPIRALDNALRNPPTGASEQRGAALYGALGPGAPITDGLATCAGCHTLNPAAGHFGGNGQTTFDAEPQVFKVPHLRNVYQKIGMFGLPDVGNTDGPFAHQGPQVRGTGFNHDGTIDTPNRFFSNGVFNLTPAQQQDMEAFMMVFPTDLAPIVGQQTTLSAALLAGPNAALLNARVDLLLQRAATPFSSQILGGASTECEVVAQVVEIAGGGSTTSKGYLRQAGGSFLPDDGGPAITAATLRAKATTPGQELTFSCVPPGSGQRMARDRDLDLVLNGLDNCPAAPNASGFGTCTAGAAASLASACSTNADCGNGGVCSANQEDADLDQLGDACEPALVPEPGGFAPLVTGMLAALAFARRRVDGRR
ncbi:MAG: thrombospondin type 3 repeat-containing protein [Deltaproteobacteria bacterium]|nr:thrombospondin type 3 repeat-containing protein [Deltaproteobacteria bacterium]